jgi:glycosyltransferase involved in cell wall biosynthesis
LGVGLFLRACGKRVIYDIHEDLPRTVTYKPYIPRRLRTVAAHTIEAFEDLAARGMSGLVAATPTIAERFECLNRQTAIVNNFPILDELAPDAGVRWESRDRAVTYIGNISEERGIRELVAAVDLLPSGVNVSLELAGRWPTASLHNELQASPQWRHVRWHGVLDRGGVRELLSRVRVGLVVLHPEPNFICSHPIKLFEYMAAGIPVIASDFPLWRRIIGGSECGLLVDPADPREIAAAIEYLLTHDAEAEAMGRRGRVAVEQRFNWDREKTKLLSLYTNVLGAPAPVIDKARVAC